MCFLSDHLLSSLRLHHCTIILLFTGFYCSQVIFFTSRLLALNFNNRLQGVGCFDWPTQRMLVSLGQTYWKSCRILLLPLMCSTESSGKHSQAWDTWIRYHFFARCSIMYMLRKVLNFKRPVSLSSTISLWVFASYGIFSMSTFRLVTALYPIDCSAPSHLTLVYLSTPFRPETP